jgi:hypothetical protein
MQGLVERRVRAIVDHLADWRPIKAIIHDLDPETIELIYDGLPAAVGFMTPNLPDTMFKSTVAAHFVRDIVNEASKAIADVLKQKKDATVDELDAAVGAAMKRVEERLVTIDQLGHYHMDGCAKVIGLSSPRRGGRNDQPVQSRNQLTFKQALDQKLLPATCCYTRVMDEKATCDKESAKPKAAKPGQKLSPLDVIGSADPELRKRFMDWLQNLEDEKRIRAMEALHELDSIEEFVGFMELPPEMRFAMIPLLENRHGKHTIKRWLGLIGSAISAGFKDLARELKEWDDGFAAQAAQARAARTVPVEQRIKEKQKKRHVKWNFRMFLPF